MPRLIPLMYAISELGDALSEHAGPLYEAAGLSSAQFQTLYIIHEEGSMRQTDLVKHRRCVKSNISYLVAGLERKGLISKRRDPNDSRVKQIALTQEGERCFLAVVEQLEQLEALLSRELGDTLVRRLELASLLAAQAIDEQATHSNPEDG